MRRAPPPRRVERGRRRLATSTHASHAYFNSLSARPDVLAAYSLRDQAQIYTYRTRKGEPSAVIYDPANDRDPRKQDAAKVLIPTLGDQYGAVLERQELKLAYQDGAFVVRYYDDVLPIAVDTFDVIFASDLDGWIHDQAGSDAANELLSVLTASRNLPPRTSRDAEAIAVRAREKEVVKRRLAALVDQSATVRALVARVIRPADVGFV